jgi:hypothetical protein
VRIRTFKRPVEFDEKPMISKLQTLEPLEPVIISGNAAWECFKRFKVWRNFLLKRIRVQTAIKARNAYAVEKGCFTLKLSEWLYAPR